MQIAPIGILGGTGLYSMPGFADAEEVALDTPYGPPSDKIRVATLDGKHVAFLARHGRGHHLSPSEVPHRANIHAMKQLGVRWLFGVNAVGSLVEAYPPGTVVLPDQFFDRTKRAPEESTFFGEGLVAHVSFGHPVCDVLRNHLARSAQEEGIAAINGGTYVNMEGPAFSTRAESIFHQQMGFHLIGMTALAEAKLAREAEIAYANMSLVTDYDAWHDEVVDVSMVVKQLHANADVAARILTRAVRALDVTQSSAAHTALHHAILTPQAQWPRARVEALLPILRRLMA
jgi:5'-methylthioadenosine phosphorylase